jgi:protein arginine kinase activator
MILCENCHQNVATVHLTEIIQSEKKEIHLCNDCANDKGITLKPFFVLNDVLGSLAGEEELPEDATPYCDHCGLSYNDFRQHGRLGCAKDYDTFKKQLNPFLEKVHNSLFHCGKVPQNSQEQVKDAQKIIRLRKSLKEAVENEEYEKAANLRDDLKKHELEIQKEPDNGL